MCSYQNHEIASEINGFYLFLSCCSLSPRHLHFRLSKVELEDFMDRSQKWGGQFGGFPRHGGTPKSSKLWTIWVLKPMVTWGFHEIPHFKSHWAMTIGVGFSVDLEVCLKKIPMIHWNGWGMVIIRMEITLQMMSLMAMINYRYHWGHPKKILACFTWGWSDWGTSRMPKPKLWMRRVCAGIVSSGNTNRLAFWSFENEYLSEEFWGYQCRMCHCEKS